MSEELKCEVCSAPAVGVCCSPLGPISHAYCMECLALGRQPYSTLMGGVMGLPKATAQEVYGEIIKSTLEFYKRPEDEFWKDVDKALEEYEAYCEQLEET